jgi:hypothetical protein
MHVALEILGLKFLAWLYLLMFLRVFFFFGGGGGGGGNMKTIFVLL